MEHLRDFLHGKFHIDVPPDYLSVHLPHGIPLLGHYSLLELVFLLWGALDLRVTKLYF